MSSSEFADDAGPPSSPTSPISIQNLNSSPPRVTRSRQKEEKAPSVTPRRFRKFFTPRSHGYEYSPARQALHEITAPALNRNVTQSSPLRPFKNVNSKEESPTSFIRGSKRQKTTHTPEISPRKGSRRKTCSFSEEANESRLGEYVQSSPCERAVLDTNCGESVEDNQYQKPVEPLKRIVSRANKGMGGQLLDLSIGSSIDRRRQHHVYPVNDWQDHTHSFYSREDDTHLCTSITGPSRTIPFCTTGCNTNSLVAVGDEEGRVRLMESAKDTKSVFKDVFHSFRVHTNAIIDMVFTDDDQLLATASGDQSARIVDMVTQTTISILGNHTASLKQVRFQPGANNHSVIATSSRDGSIQIWDLRVNGYSGPLHQMYRSLESDEHTNNHQSNDIQWGRAVNSIWNAHKPYTRQTPSLNHADAGSRGESIGRAGDLSVTAIEFLPGREHLLISASEADCSIMLWDIRSIHPKRKGQLPLSVTKKVQSHSTWRHFGINSLNLSTDGSRIFSLCKDNTVYAYSTSHLITGHAPELSLTSQERYLQRDTQEGLGPIYGFRHPQLHASSFYVKSAVRKAKDGKCEMLAVGNSGGSPILFPTDERYFPKTTGERSAAELNAECVQKRPTLARVGSGTFNARVETSIPISMNGTPLVRGHDREVGNLAWTHDGELVTVGDDFLVRLWREGGNNARDLRMGGEVDGRRWACGWADVSEGYDDDDC
ncbi:WD40 repeat-like protein [Stipitochalara longipes BDJ]|nr:WD40 repeat-like protein [Stipitochalara longipes BDJ]